MLRSIVALFSLLFLISLCTAKTAIAGGIEWTYTVSNGEASIGHGESNVSGKPAIPISTIGHLVIPSTLGGYPVTRIGHYAFYCCSGLTMEVVYDRCKFEVGLCYLKNNNVIYKAYTHV
jgi:hypothetical protein